MTEFMNDDSLLRERADRVLAERKEAGLEDTVAGLRAVVVNVEQGGVKAAVQEMLRRTGYVFKTAFEDPDMVTCVLTLPGSADFLIRGRKGVANPFAQYNVGPKSSPLPNTRLETFIYGCDDLEAYVAKQHKQGRRFMTHDVLHAPGHSFIQTLPSRFTGNSLGFIQWRGDAGDYMGEQSKVLDWSFEKPSLPHLKDIGFLDHSATRVRAEDRDNAIIEFMEYTNYAFDFAVYVESLNSITNVARLGPGEYAQVFTSGIKPFAGLEDSGPTERYIYNYNLRVHHLAYATENIEATFQALKDDGMGFLVELAGSREEGLKQTFSEMSPNTFLVNEYIHRFDGFTGFFTKSNVTILTKATEKQ